MGSQCVPASRAEQAACLVSHDTFPYTSIMSNPRTIALLNQKGGVGKTTSTVNLGAAIAQLDKRVCLIDLDPQAHLTLHLGLDPDALDNPGQCSVYDLLVDDEITAADALTPARENLFVIGAEVDLAGAETELAAHPDRQRILRRKFASVADRFDVVLIDCPPSLGLLTLNALSLAREVIVPMQAHFLALQGVSKLLETVGLVGRSVNPEICVSGIVLCMHEGQTTLAREIVADLETFFEQAQQQEVPWRNCRVLKPAVRRNIKLAEAPSFGQTIFDYEPWCPGANDYRKLAQQVLGMNTPAEGAASHTVDERVPEIVTISTPEGTPGTILGSTTPTEVTGRASEESDSKHGASHVSKTSNHGDS